MKRPAIKQVQKRVVYISIGASTLRGQEPGTVKTAREYLMELDLTKLKDLSGGEFTRWLDERTKELMGELEGHSWGVARKAINVFLENAFYNKFLSEQYNLDRLEAEYELPLDSNVAKGLKAGKPSHVALPNWDSIKRLNATDSKSFQNCANNIAQQKQISRIYLDLYYWNN